MRCHNCGSNKVESEASSGTSFCVDCGTVLEENTIVAEVTFGETSGGKAILQGSFAGESGRISGGGLFGRNRGREGQEQAIENGRLKIANLAHAVRLPERYREAAQRYYNLAVVNRFTRGRRSDHVAAVCLYAVCRTEKSSHMLIDFSDILQVNVFTLGATFLKLCRVLNLNLPHVDPSLYISRFAVALDFGDYTQRVAQDAVRIAQRMDRDWITSGRRPAGICGACLLIAARMNGFRRTTKEMIYVVRVAEVTIQKRLYEFNQTESSQLSVRDFRTIWLEKRADPPSFIKNRREEKELDSQDDSEMSSEGEKSVNKKRKLSTVIQKRSKKRLGAAKLKEEEEEDELEESDDMLDVSEEEIDGPFGKGQKNISEADNGVKSLSKKVTILAEDEDEDSDMENNIIQQEMDNVLNEEIKHIADIDSNLSTQASSIKLKGKEKDTQDTQVGTQLSELPDTQETLVEAQTSYIPLKNKIYNELSEAEKIELTARAKASVAQEEKDLLNPNLEMDAQEIAAEMENWMGDDSVIKAAKEIETQRLGDDEEEDDDEEEGRSRDDGSLSDVDCEEIDAMILSPEEVALKTKVWYTENKDYLEEMAVRRMIEKDKGTHHAKKGKQKHKKKLPPAATPAEAAKQLLVNKKLSKKINQAVFDDMFESPESIAKIKARDAIKRITGSSIPEVGDYEVVEESGDAPTKPQKKKVDGTPTANGNTAQEPAAAEGEEEEDDDDEMDSDDMADDERFLRDARANYALDDDVPDYGDDYGDDDDF